MMQKIIIPLLTRNIDGYLYTSTDDTAPGVIFLHDLMGAVDTCHAAAKAIAVQGYHVLVPDLYSGGVTQFKYCTRHIFERATRYNEQNSEHLDEIHSIIAYFKNLAIIEGKGIGIVGQCLTGGFILHAAIRKDIQAPVVFHHSFGTKGSGIPKGCAAMIEQPIQGHFSSLPDVFCTTAKVDKLEQQLEGKLIRYQYLLPHGIPHVFFKTDEGRLAFDRMMGFFEQQLRG